VKCLFSIENMTEKQRNKYLETFSLLHKESYEDIENYFKQYGVLHDGTSVSFKTMSYMIVFMEADSKQYNLNIKFDVNYNYLFGKDYIKYTISARNKQDTAEKSAFINVNYNQEHEETLLKSLSLFYLYQETSGDYYSDVCKKAKNIIQNSFKPYHINDLYEQIDRLEKENNRLKSYNSRPLIYQRENIKPKCYLMIDEATGLVKIGKSINPENRERTLQSEKPTIKMIHYFDNDIERELHNKFRDKRVRGEWFRLDMNEVSEIIKAKKSSL